MKNKRETERLGKMFSGIEVLAVNPAGKHPEIQPELEIPSSQISDPEESLAQRDIGEFTAEAELFADPPPVEQQNSNGLILPEHDSIESTHLDEKLETLLESSLPLPDLSNATPLPTPFESQTNSARQASIPQSLDRQPRTDEANRADWLDVGIGALTGFLVTGAILAGTSQLDIFNNPGRFILLGWEVLSGILGASASRSSKKGRRGAWIGAIQWCLVPVWIALFIAVMIYFLTFTNFFGK